MVDSNLTDNAPATKLFPQFPYQVYEMLSAEVAGLTDAQLDFETDQWEWGKWSIRRNLSHMSSGDVRWLWGRWRSQVFPDGRPDAEELDSIVNSPHDRRLNEDLYWEPAAILGKLWEGLELCRSVLEGETVASLAGQGTGGGGDEPERPLPAPLSRRSPGGSRRPVPHLHNPGNDFPAPLLRVHHASVQHPAAEAGPGANRQGVHPQGGVLDRRKLGPQRALGELLNPLDTPDGC